MTVMAFCFPLLFFPIIRVMIASDRACFGMQKTLCFLDCYVHSRSILCQLVGGFNVSQNIRAGRKLPPKRKKYQNIVVVLETTTATYTLIMTDHSTFPWLRREPQ